MVSFSPDSEKHEECGVIAVVSKKGEDVAPYLYRALVALQHRGQDAAGFVVLGKGGLVARHGLGLVTDIFTSADMGLEGHMGIGHTRYPTTGRCLIQDVQPSLIGDISVAHNGHLANYDAVREALEKAGYKFNGTVDSEPIAFLLDSKLKTGATIEDAVRHVIATLDGAYSDVAIIRKSLAVFRDPHAIRPLVWGENERFISFASESCALDVNGIPYKGVVEGGELIILNQKMERKSLLKKEPRHCMFEYVYFSRPDSIINGKAVYEVRKRLGQMLAKEHPAKADLVVAVPDTSRTAAEAYAKSLNIPVEEGLIKNRYIGRTFIMANQEKRSDNVRLKINPVSGLVGGKSVVLIDDSIVRGTTLKEIVALVRGAGAKEVHVRITCPPLRAPCFYGVDMKSYRELIANRKSEDEVAKFLGVDSLGYLSLEGLRRAIGLPICTGCLNEDYITPLARQMAKERKDEDLHCG
ncbi:MAG: amidophosphoribosyltransferase [Candidatus Micrarchaeota archaeon]